MNRLMIFVVAALFMSCLQAEEDDKQLPDFDANESPIHMCYKLETIPKASLQEEASLTEIALADEEN